MPDQGSICTKAYFLPVRGEAGEVHRFSLDENVSTNFTYFTQKLENLYPEIKGKEMIITYKDCDGDDVRIGSDEELIQALLETQTLKQDVFKVRVKAKATKPKENETDRGAVHPGVICDGCNSSVRGSRYKCLICTDYDLCSVCEHKGIHGGHNMMRIDTPLIRSAPWSHMMSGCGRQYPGVGHGQWKRHCGPRREPNRAKTEDNGNGDMKNLGEFLGNILGGFTGNYQQQCSREENKETGTKPKQNEKKQEETKQEEKKSNYKSSNEEAKQDAYDEIPEYLRDWFKIFTPPNGQDNKSEANPWANLFTFFNGVAGNNQGSTCSGRMEGHNFMEELFKHFCKGSQQSPDSKATATDNGHPFEQLMNMFHSFMEKSCPGLEENFCENLISSIRSAINNPCISQEDRTMFEGFLNDAEATLKTMRESKAEQQPNMTTDDDSTKMDTDTEKPSTSAESTRIYPDPTTGKQNQHSNMDTGETSTSAEGIRVFPSNTDTAKPLTSAEGIRVFPSNPDAVKPSTSAESTRIQPELVTGKQDQPCEMDTDKPSTSVEAASMYPKNTDTDKPSTSAEATSIYPDLTADKESQDSEEMLVAQTLKQLLGMGYSNDGGWLIQLIRAKQGNINKVLEILLPKSAN